MIPSEWAIRQAVAALIRSVDSDAVVLPKFVLDVMIGENANLLKPTAGPDAGKIHGWMVGDPSEENKRVGSVTVFEDDSSQDNTSFRLDTRLVYPIWGFLFYRLGNDANDTDSTKRFSDIRTALVEKFARKPRLGVAGNVLFSGGNQVKRHHELQLASRPDIVQMGKEWAHYASYELAVELYRTPAG